MKKIIFGILIAISTFMFLISCGEKSKKSEFFISNPTDNAITVKLDGKDYNIEANKYEKIKLDAGNHSYEYNGEKVDFLVTFENEGGVINPTQTAHITFRMVYQTSDSKTNFNPGSSELIIEDVVYEGPMSIVKDKIIDNKVLRISYGLDTPLPKSIRVTSDRDGNIKTKIFTPKDFIDFWEEETDTKGNHESIKKVGEEIKGTIQKTGYEDINNEIPDYKTPELKEKAQKVLELDNAYINANSASEQKKIISQYKKAWKEYVQTSMKMTEEDKKENLSGSIIPKYLGRGVIMK